MPVPLKRALLGLALPALAILGLPLVLRLTVDNSIEQWLTPSPDQARVQREFQAHFGSDEIVVVAVTAEDVWAPTVLDPLMELATALEQLPGVARVSGVPVELRDRFGGEDIDAMRAAALGSPFYEDLFVGRDENTLGLILQAGSNLGPTGRLKLIDGVRKALSALPETIDAHMAGPPVLNVALDRASTRETARYLPVAVLVSAAVLLLVLPSWRLTFATMALASVAVMLTLELMVLSGRPLTMVTAALPPLIWVMTLATAIRLITTWRGVDETSPDRRLIVALAHARRPCVVASLTTAAGFLSLGLSSMRPVRDLGLFAAVGAVASLLLCMGTIPLLLRRMNPTSRRAMVCLPTFISSVGLKYPKTVVGLAGIFLVAAFLAAPAIKIQANPLQFLSPASEVAQDYRFVRDRLTGWYTLEIMIRAPGGWLDEGYWPALEALDRRIAGLPGVTRMLSPLDLLRRANQWEHDLDAAEYALPHSGEHAERLVEAMSDYERAALRSLVAADDKTLRLAVIVNSMDSDTFGRLVRSADAALRELPQPLSGIATGTVLQLVQAQHELVRSQLLSLCGALLVVFACVAAGLGQAQWTAFAVAPNVMPLAAISAWMVIAGIPLDPATVMVASITLGVAVDDTVHVLVHLKQHRMGSAAVGIVQTTMGTLEPAMTATTLTMCAGFASLTFSGFQPVRWFGLLSCVGLSVALAADLWLLPAQLKLLCKEFRHG